MAGKNDPQSTISAIVNDFLNIPASNLNGIGPKRAELLCKKGLKTVFDLLYFFPRSYEDRTRAIPFAQLEDGKHAFTGGTVLWAGEEKIYSRRKRLYKIIISDDIHQLELIWFNLSSRYFSSLSVPDLRLSVYGIIKRNGNKIQMYHPDVSISDGQGETPAYLPLYPAIEGISNRVLRTIIKTAIEQYLEPLLDPVPADILKTAGLPGLKETIRMLHSPDLETDFTLLKNADTVFHKRIVFDRFFTLMLRTFHNRQQRIYHNVMPLKISDRLFHGIRNFFPFTLTEDQLLCIKEIREDLISGSSMNRLVMGDVGTGKTVVAVAAAYMSIRNRLQVTIMAPTQLLAEQHMAYFMSLPPDMGFKPVLLTGNCRVSERKEIYESVRDGIYNTVIGTHSLVRDGLTFRNLGLAIIDEQHRFGVRQRSALIEKGKNTHVLSMSATPIPRTIALTLYYDRDLSIISQYPGSRVPVSTMLAGRKDKRWIFDTVHKKLCEGCQVYIICPLTDESENVALKNVVDMTQDLRKILDPGYRVEYLHGQLDHSVKDSILTDFREGRIKILVATTVIEVGIHVPNASLMIIEHPERLGLAQLHQLRGRIGRDGKGGTCILVTPENPSEITVKRLAVIEECDNGFDVAQKDLEFRGHGEITGLRQSGFNEFGISEVINRYDLFIKTRDMVKDIFESDPDLRMNEHRYIKSAINEDSIITT